MPLNAPNIGRAFIKCETNKYLILGINGINGDGQYLILHQVSFNLIL